MRYIVQRVSVPFARPYWNLYRRPYGGPATFVAEFRTKRAAEAARDEAARRDARKGSG